MIVLALEEFAPRRRLKQRVIEEKLKPYVVRALDGKINTGGYGELLGEVASQWAEAYEDTRGVAGPKLPRAFRDAITDTLRKTDRPRSDANTVATITVWLATAILGHATVTAADDDDAELELEWVDMNDSRVRHTHADANGQTVKPGEPFTVGGEKMPYPGYPGVAIALWINCRCATRPKLAQTDKSVAAALLDRHAAAKAESRLVGHGVLFVPDSIDFKDYTPKQRKDAHTLPDGSFPIEDCADLKNAIQAIGRAKDPAKAKAHIRKRKGALGCPDVELPESFASEEGDGIPAMPGEDSRAEAPDPTAPPEPVDVPTHAGLAVQASDTGRVLMLQRTLDPTDDPDVQGTWEFPGGGIEDGEEPYQGACREFCEETGLPVPEGSVTGGWVSPDGVYQCFVLSVDLEREAFGELNPDLAAAEMVNPDDPKRNRPDVTAWFSIPQIQGLGPALRPACANSTDWSQFSVGGGDMWHPETDPEEDGMTENAPEAEPTTDPAQAAGDGGLIPWHGVLTVEGIRSGDGRKFGVGAMRARPLPLPITWQKNSAPGHGGSPVVARMDRAERVGAEIRGSGVVLQNAEADEMVGLVSAFGRFGISVDADDATMETDPDAEDVVYSDARTAGACVVPIPAFHQAWFALGEHPEDFYNEGTPLATDGDELGVAASLVASVGVDESQMIVPMAELNEADQREFVAMFADLAPGLTEDGPGWLTNPVDTDRLRDYWTKGEGAAKIGWGTHPGDFNTCRSLLAKYIKPEFLSGYCANRHHDALGVWPGQEASAAESLEFTEPAELLSLVASAGVLKAPADWFRMAEPDHLTPLTITEEGQVFGHVAGWNVCHANVSAYGECFLAPHSQTDYARFMLGATLTTEGQIATGTLTLGPGHADEKLRMRPALAHYDSTATAWASVTAVDGKHGIWVCGWVLPGTTAETVVKARATPPSGDWRLDHATRSYEMIACLQVISPGYATPRVKVGFANGEMVSLVAAGGFEAEDTNPTMDLDPVAFAEKVVIEMANIESRRKAMAELAARHGVRESV